MKTIKILAITICLSMVFASCNKFLDTPPRGKLIPSEVEDFSRLLDNVNTVTGYDFMDNNRGSRLISITDDAKATYALGQGVYLNANHVNIDRYFAYRFTQPYTNPEVVDYFWNFSGMSGYGLVGRIYNTVIEETPKVAKPATEGQAKEIIAQAKAARAHLLFKMAMSYGPVYKPGGDNSGKSIPYLTSSDPNLPAPMISTQEEAFALCIKDLTEALADAPERIDWVTRFSKLTINTTLAYIYMFKADWDKVLSHTNEAWRLATAIRPESGLFFDYNTFSFQYPNNPEGSKGTISSKIDEPLTVVDHKEMMLYRQAPGTGSFYPSDELIGLFDTATDLRFKFRMQFYAGSSAVIGGVTYKDTCYQQQNTIFTQTQGFSYPEILLMRAEAYARKGQLAEARADLNTIRKYRHKTGTPEFTGGSQDEVIHEIINERRREFTMNTMKRFFDLKRLVNDAGKPWCKTEIVHTMGSNTYTGKIDSEAFQTLIPNAILRFNPNWGIPLDTRTWGK